MGGLTQHVIYMGVGELSQNFFISSFKWGLNVKSFIIFMNKSGFYPNFLLNIFC